MANASKGSSALKPDLDWSQVRETINMLTLAVAQIEATMTDGEKSVSELSQSFTFIAALVSKLLKAGEDLEVSQANASTIEHIRATSSDIDQKINQAIIAFQFYDRLTQRIHHVKSDLCSLSELIASPDRLYNPQEWHKLQEEIKQNYTMEEERIMYEHIMRGATLEEALEIYRHHFTNKDPDDHAAEDDIELF